MKEEEELEVGVKVDRHRVWRLASFVVTGTESSGKVGGVAGEGVE